jgi:hypothetical protein
VASLCGCAAAGGDGAPRGPSGGAGGGLAIGAGGDVGGAGFSSTGGSGILINAGSGGAAGGGGAAGTNCNQDVDVVFVLDVSGSMIPPLTTLNSEVGLVDAALQTKNLPGPPHYGLVIFVDDVVLMNGGAPYPDLAALKAAVAAEINTTNLVPTRQAGPGGPANLSWPENSLDGLYMAATAFKWRPAATTLRTVIHITDASFWDLTAVSSVAGDPGKLEANTTGSTSLHSYDDTIGALRASNIWVNTFTARTGGPPGFPLSPPSHGLFRGVSVNVGIGFHENYNGKPSIAASTGGLAWNIDDVFDKVISLATPINQAITQAHCMEYPPIPQVR